MRTPQISRVARRQQTVLVVAISVTIIVVSAIPATLFLLERGVDAPLAVLLGGMFGCTVLIVLTIPLRIYVAIREWPRRGR